MKKIVLLNFAFLTMGIATAQNAASYNESSAISNEAQQTLNNVDNQFFIENKGQWPAEVLFLTQMGGLNAWITTKGMWYEFTTDYKNTVEIRLFVNDTQFFVTMMEPSNNLDLNFKLPIVLKWDY